MADRFKTQITVRYTSTGHSENPTHRLKVMADHLDDRYITAIIQRGDITAEIVSVHAERIEDE